MSLESGSTYTPSLPLNAIRGLSNGPVGIISSLNVTVEGALIGQLVLQHEVNILIAWRRRRQRRTNTSWRTTTTTVSSTRTSLWAVTLGIFEMSFLRFLQMKVLRRMKNAPRKPPRKPRTSAGIRVRMCIEMVSYFCNTTQNTSRMSVSLTWSSHRLDFWSRDVRASLTDNSMMMTAVACCRLRCTGLSTLRCCPLHDFGVFLCDYLSP